MIAQASSGDLGHYQWTGREYDAEINLQYNRARYYDPGTGRWISQDQLGFGAGDSNLYRYCFNRPVNATDPSGFQSRTTLRDSVTQLKQQVKELKKALLYALLAESAYGNSIFLPNLGKLGWSLEKEWNNDDTGFRSRLFKSDTSKDVVLSFEGTNPTSLPDWKTNFGQGLGYIVSQYKQATDLAIKVSADSNKKERSLTFTGHSLGGGLATLASLKVQLPAVTFNAAGISEGTALHYRVNLADSTKLVTLADGSKIPLVTAYRVKGEILSTLQDKFFRFFRVERIVVLKKADMVRTLEVR